MESDESVKLYASQHGDEFTIPELTIGYIGIDDIVIHPDYDPVTKKNNIAMIKVPADLFADDDNLTRNACLPSGITNDYEEEKATIVGYGHAKEDEIRPETHSANITLDSKQCDSLKNFDSATQICGGTSEKGACGEGDNGGGLFVEENSRYTLIGVVSDSPDCNDTDSNAGIN